MRLGLFGGRFDPPHLGHLLAAEAAREELGLDEVWFVPAKAPPHKGTTASPQQRFEMVELAIVGNPAFRASRIELDRAGASYTIDTLHEVRGVAPHATLYFITGVDAYRDIGDWHRARDVVEYAHMIALPRPGASLAGMEPFFRGRVRLLKARHIEISSTEIRDRVGSGRSVRYLVPASVERYLAGKDLYR